METKNQETSTQDTHIQEKNQDFVKCQLEVPVLPKPLTDAYHDKITVGRHVLLNCNGEWNKAFDMSRAHFKLDEKQQLVLKLFKAEARSAGSFDIDFTIYKSGQLQIPELILTDDTHEINLGSQNFTIVSVLDPQKEAKPNGLIFPLNIDWPIIYFIFLFVVLISALGFIVFRIRKAKRFAQLIEDLKQHTSNSQADVQFYKNMRLAEKENYSIELLEKALRLYCLRVFQVPFFKLNNIQIDQFFKKHRSQFKEESKKIKNFLSEFEEIKSKNLQLNQIEKNQMAKKLYRFVELNEQKSHSLEKTSDGRASSTPERPKERPKEKPAKPDPLNKNNRQVQP